MDTDKWDIVQSISLVDVALIADHVSVHLTQDSSNFSALAGIPIGV
jgi:hypothetical protein